VGGTPGNERRVEVKVKDILIQSDDAGGILVIREGNDPAFLKRTLKNSVRCNSVMARILQAFRDDIMELQGKPLAKKKGRA
jgi:hypothetical protein